MSVIRSADIATGMARVRVGGARVSVIGLDGILDAVTRWAREGRSAVCVACNVHVAMSAEADWRLARAVGAADLCVCDGAPIAWFVRSAGFPQQTRVSGPDLMLSICERAETEGIGVALYGSTQRTLDRLAAGLLARYPRLDLRYTCSPPFRSLTIEEDAAVVEQMRSSGARIVFVGLGCPRQELWMAEHKNRIDAVMLGVGAAFDFHAGVVERAPSWMQASGLEWLHRLVSEPRRLWKRYLVTNTRFLLFVARVWQRRRLLVEQTLDSPRDG